jgi:hypothetical protein
MQILGGLAHYCGPAAIAALLSPGILVAAPDEIIDANRSVLIVHVGKTGLFSAAGHEHWVDAPISRGQFNDGAEAHVEFVVDARKMMVRPDEKTSAKDRATIQETMQSSVMESEKYPEIRFRSTSVTPMGGPAWRVGGTLTLHGVSKAVAVEVRRDGDVYAGSAHLKQTEFGIQPVSIAGGAVKVKNELDITFKISAVAK